MQTTKLRGTWRIAAFIAIVIALLLTTASGVSAEAEVSRDRITFETNNEVDVFLTDACGLTVIADGTLSIHIIDFGDGRSKVHIQSSTSLTSSEAQLSTLGNSMVHFESSELIDNGDGTSSLLIPHREVGSFVFLIPGGNVADGGVH